MNKAQKHQLEMALEVDRICKKYNLKYNIDGGTLLGAIRHKGFIPWDDDLDIDMPRSDYEKFCEVAQKELGDKYFLQTWNTEPNYAMTFAKIRENNTIYLENVAKNVDVHQGIWIDIFPHDVITDNVFLQKILVKKAVLYRLLLQIKKGYIIETPSFSKRVILAFLKFLAIFTSAKSLKKKLQKMQFRYQNKNTNSLVDYSSVLFNKMIYDKKVMNEYVPVSFEGKTLMGLKDYDTYLTYLYGDYMTPPPEGQRENRHGIIQVDFNTKQK